MNIHLGRSDRGTAIGILVVVLLLLLALFLIVYLLIALLRCPVRTFPDEDNSAYAPLSL